MKTPIIPQKRTALERLTDTFKLAIGKRDDKIAELEGRIDRADGGSGLKMDKIISGDIRIRGPVSVKEFPKDQMVHGSVSVDNLPAVQDVKIVGHEGLAKAIAEGIKHPGVQDVRVLEAEVGLKAEHWLPGAIARAGANQTGFIIKALRALIGDGIRLRIGKEDVMSPIPVIITDGEGRVLRGMGGPAYGGIPMGGGRSSGTYIPGVIGSGRATLVTPATPVRLRTVATPCAFVTVVGAFDNTGLVFVGGADVSGVAGSEKGVPLSPLGSVKIDINDVSKLYIDAPNASDDVTFIYQL